MNPADNTHSNQNQAKSLGNIGIVGHQGVGKDMVSNYIVDHFQYQHVSTSDFIREYIAKHNLGTPTRDLMREIGNKLRAEHGGDYLVRLAFEKSPDNTVVSGMRAIEEVESFKSKGGIVIGVTAPIELRYKWTQGRGRAGDGVTLEEFKRHEMHEADSQSAKTQNINAVMSMADYVITNDGSVRHLHAKIADIIAIIREK